ncbi:MAG: glycosyltransferase family A protein, partial [Patescibacteria group bacterium]
MSRVEIVENYLASQTQFPEDAHKLENPLSGHVDISIIVPIFNEDAVLPNLLHALENQIYRGFELVVVDNGSTDNSLLRLSQFSQKSPFEIVIIKEEKPGIGNARKLGLDFAVRRVRNRDKTLFRKHALLLTDADVAPPPNWTKVVKEKLDSLPPSCLSGTHGADPKIEKVISRGLGLTYYFNKIPSAIEWLQKAKFGIIKMSGPNASFEIEAYCAGGGMQQKEDVLDNAVVVKGVSQLGWRAEERGY